MTQATDNDTTLNGPAHISGRTSLAEPADGSNVPPYSDCSDAELLAACDRFQAAHAQRESESAAGGVTDERYRELDDAWDDALDDVCALQPQTLAGLSARIGVSFIALRSKVTVELGRSWLEQADAYDSLALQCLAAAEQQFHATNSELDAELTALWRKIVRLEAEYDAVSDEVDEEARQRLDAICDEENEAIHQVTISQPGGLGGFRAKARAIHAYCNGRFPDGPGPATVAIWSLITDLADSGRPGLI